MLIIYYSINKLVGSVASNRKIQLHHHLLIMRIYLYIWLQHTHTKIYINILNIHFMYIYRHINNLYINKYLWERNELDIEARLVNVFFFILLRYTSLKVVSYFFSYDGDAAWSIGRYTKQPKNSWWLSICVVLCVFHASSSTSIPTDVYFPKYEDPCKSI